MNHDQTNHEASMQEGLDDGSYRHALQVTVRCLKQERDAAIAAKEKAERERDQWKTWHSEQHDVTIATRKERDAAIARAEKAEAEAASQTRRAETHLADLVAYKRECRNLTEQRDAAIAAKEKAEAEAASQTRRAETHLADLVAYKRECRLIATLRDDAIARAENAERERDAWADRATDGGDYPDLMAQIRNIERERDAAIAAKEKAEAQADRAMKERDEIATISGERFRLIAELGCERDAAWAELAQLKQTYNQLHDACRGEIEEREAAQARVRELEALLSEVRWDAKDADGLPQDEFNCLMRRIDAALGGGKS